VAVSEVWTQAPTPSSTVMLVRDGADGDLEVLLLERVLRSDFAGGALVFPGGKVDPADGRLDRDRWRGPDPVTDAEALGLDDPTEALAVRSAAVRETFEEAGVLLAVRGDGSPLTAQDLASDAFVAARAALNDRGPAEAFHDFLGREDLVLELGALGFWSWWVTPEGQHRRYDTRFFVATVPTLQREVAAHDEVETASARWSTPSAALAAAAADEVTIIFPTRWNLRELAAHDTAEAALAAALAGEVDTARTLPTVEVVDGVPLVQHPRGGDPEPF
jgi:8-oxo-dGTP pyrophosphatase MutT (NUDIX family)